MSTDSSADPTAERASTGPLSFLVEMLTDAWGEPRVAPPSEPSGRSVYRSETDGLVWVKLADYSRRAWVWFPDGQNHALSANKGAFYTVRMSAGRRSAEVRVFDGYWPSRQALEGIARFVYALPAPENGEQP
jgi:hypothetical protein